MRKSPIPPIEDIRSRTDIPVFQVAEDIEWMVGPVQVDGNDFQSVVSFARAVGAKALLVQYDYPDFDDYFVDLSIYDVDRLFGEEREDEIKELAEERNDEFEDFLESDYDNQPFGVSIYVMYEGTPYGMFMEDDALIESFGETADEFIARLYLEDIDDEDRAGVRARIRAISAGEMESGEGVEPP